MTNVIKFPVPDSETNKYCADGEKISVVNLATGIEVIASKNTIELVCGNYSKEFTSRQDLAEFLWMAAHLVDSHGRYKFDEYVGLNY